MLTDYYAVLGVEPTAELASIRQAYRKRASACHPDHGGSHAQMLAINEAWSILSDPEKRARYDEARRQPNSAAAHASATEDIQSARRQAADYPQEWSKFEDWLNIVAADFTRAKYGKSSGYYGTTWPTASNSLTAIIFIGTGGVVGVVLFLGVFGASGLKMGGPMLRPLFLGSLFAACGGAWVGHWLHQIVSSVIPSDPVPRKSPQASGHGTMTCVVRCPNCGQQLRLPKLPQPLAVTCQKCRHAFDLPPSQL